LGDGTVGETLGKICAQYGLNYRVDVDGTVLLELAKGKSSEALVEKVYWLKPGSLSGDGPADKILAAQGIDFPPGATARWQAGEGN